MKIHTFCVMAVLSAVLATCAKQSTELELTADEGNSLTELTLACVTHHDGGDRRAMVLSIHNSSDRELESIRLTFDDAYSSSLEKLHIHQGYRKGSQALGTARMLPGENLEFIFSHDTSNHQLMKNEAGETLPANFIPKTITIHAGDASANWRAKSPEERRNQ